MTTAWSRWLLGAWAVATAVWLMVATLMLVQTLPEPSPRNAENALFGQVGTQSQLHRAMQGRTGAGQQVGTILLVVLLPPVILLIFVLGGMRLAGLPLPSLRQAARNKPSSAKS